MCVICKEPKEPSLRVTLGEKGSASINKASKERKDSIQCVLYSVFLILDRSYTRNAAVSIVYHMK